MKNRQRFIETSPYDLLLKMNCKLWNKRERKRMCIMDALGEPRKCAKYDKWRKEHPESKEDIIIYNSEKWNDPRCCACIQDWLNNEE